MWRSSLSGAEPPLPRDVLILFGARVRATGKPSPLLRRRLTGAVEASKRCVDPLFLVMGGEGDAGPTEADVMAQTLREHGVPQQSIWRERRSQDTLEQVRMAAAILGGMDDIRQVLVCTSPFHQPRCRLLLRLLGIPSIAPPMPADLVAIGLRNWLYYGLREVAATGWDAFLLCLLVLIGRGRLNPRG